MGIWISVDKRLPEVDEFVLYRTVSGMVGSGYYDKDTKIWHKSDKVSPVVEKVLLWQKAPSGLK